MREFRTYGSVRGALSNERPYRDSRPLFACVPTVKSGRDARGPRAAYPGRRREAMTASAGLPDSSAR